MSSMLDILSGVGKFNTSHACVCETWNRISFV